MLQKGLKNKHFINIGMLNFLKKMKAILLFQKKD